MKHKYILGLFALSLAACKPNIEPTAPSGAGLDFNRYVAVGNSLTAGYADGSLYRSAQQSSYPAILSSQFGMVGGGSFNQPLLPDDTGWPDAKLVLGYATDCKGVTSLGPVPFNGTPNNTASSQNISSQGPFNNVGVPGIRCIDFLLAGYAQLNPYAARFYKYPDIQTPLDEAIRMDPTFFTMWLGSNDVLGYATNGGEGSAPGVFPTDISPEPVFKIIYDSVITAMTTTGAKGALLNIPDVTAIPYFTTISPKGLVLDKIQVLLLNAAYVSLGIKFTEGANNFIIQDLAAPGGLRKIKDNELILITIPQDSLKCAGWGSTKPIPKSFVLDETEIGNVRAATNDFNKIIMDNAISHKLAYVDINAYLKTVNSGIMFNGVTFNTTFVTGGAFSLDGVHLTPRGYALVANEVIRNINAYYGATISMADVNKYSGIRLP